MSTRAALLRTSRTDSRVRTHTLGKWPPANMRTPPMTAASNNPAPAKAWITVETPITTDHPGTAHIQQRVAAITSPTRRQGLGRHLAARPDGFDGTGKSAHRPNEICQLGFSGDPPLTRQRQTPSMAGAISPTPLTSGDTILTWTQRGRCGWTDRDRAALRILRDRTEFLTPSALRPCAQLPTPAAEGGIRSEPLTRPSCIATTVLTQSVL
jgi:hypothetical protein